MGLHCCGGAPLSRTGPMRHGKPWTELREKGHGRPDVVEFVGKSTVIKNFHWYVKIDGHHWSNKKPSQDGYLIDPGDGNW